MGDCVLEVGRELRAVIASRLRKKSRWFKCVVASQSAVAIDVEWIQATHLIMP